jgi:hypothetical protein
MRRENIGRLNKWTRGRKIDEGHEGTLEIILC